MESGNISDAKDQYDSGEKTGALMQFMSSVKTLNIRIGISFISALKAKEKPFKGNRGENIR